MAATTDIGIDLGTSSILVYAKGKGIVLKEPSVVAYDKDADKVRAIGEEARQMIGRTPGNIMAVRPMRQGVITDFLITERMLRYFIQKAMGRRAFRKPRISICVPSGVTEVERKAVEEATYLIISFFIKSDIILLVPIIRDVHQTYRSISNSLMHKSCSLFKHLRFKMNIRNY